MRHCKFSDFSSRQNVGIIEGLLEFDQGYKTIDKQYHQTFIISRIVVGNKIVDHWDVINWSITCRRYSSFILILEWTPGLNGSGKGNCKTRRETVIFGIWCGLHLSFDDIKTHPLCICKSNLKHSYTLLHIFWLAHIYYMIQRPWNQFCKWQMVELNRKRPLR